MIDLSTGKEVNQQSYATDVVITDGLLNGQIFRIEDIENIKEGESINCFGRKGTERIFDEKTFDETFE